MKTSDIPDEPILRVLSKLQGTWSSHFWTKELIETFPVEIRETKLVLSKMRSLHKRGLVGGCACGCRGDWEITDKGLEQIGVKRTVKYHGY